MVHEALGVIDINEVANGHLLEVVDALRLVRAQFGFRQRRQQQAREDGDDRDHHKQFDQSKSPEPAKTLTVYIATTHFSGRLFVDPASALSFIITHCSRNWPGTLIKWLPAYADSHVVRRSNISLFPRFDQGSTKMKNRAGSA